VVERGKASLAASAHSRVSPRSGACSGFTLIELLVTLTLLAVISGGITLAFGTSLQTFSTLRHRAEIADRTRTLTERLRADLAGAWLRSGSTTTWFRGLSPDAAQAVSITLPQGNVLSLTTARPMSLDAVREDVGVGGLAEPQSDVAQVSWWLETAPDGTRDLVRSERTPPDPEVDETLDPAVTRTVLARGVRDMSLRFFDGVQWLDQWDAGELPAGTETETDAALPNTGLPRLVEVTLEFASEGMGVPVPIPGLSDEEQLPATGYAPRWTLVIALPQPVDPAE
jgi:prepilin-type N-terminal cleavage/methylation domain-containing protein